MSTGRGSPVRQPAMRCETRRFILLKASLRRESRTGQPRHVHGIPTTSKAANPTNRPVAATPAMTPTANDCGSTIPRLMSRDRSPARTLPALRHAAIIKSAEAAGIDLIGSRSSSLLDDGPRLNLDPGTERERGRREGGPCRERRAKELRVGTIEGRPVREVSQVHIDFDDLLSCNTGVGEDVAEVAERLLELGPEAALDHLPVVAQADLTGRGDRLSNPTPWAERSDRLCHESLLLFYFVSGCGANCATPRPKDQFSL